MKLYIQFAFCAGVLLFAIRIVEMACRQWPQNRPPKSLGQHCAETFIGIAFTLWAAWLLFANSL